MALIEISSEDVVRQRLQAAGIDTGSEENGYLMGWADSFVRAAMPPVAVVMAASQWDSTARFRLSPEELPSQQRHQLVRSLVGAMVTDEIDRAEALALFDHSYERSVAVPSGASSLSL